MFVLLRLFSFVFFLISLELRKGGGGEVSGRMEGEGGKGHL